MTDKISSSLPIKLLWQGAIIVALILAAWVLEQTLIKVKKISVSAEVIQAPRLTSTDPSALETIDNRIASAKQEIIIAARSLTAIPILKNLQAKQAAGVSVYTLLSPDTLATPTGSDLLNWMRTNQYTGVYQDARPSASYVIVIDEQTVIISDLPFSQHAYEPADAAAAQTAAVGFVTVIDDPRLASAMAARLKARLQYKIL